MTMKIIISEGKTHLTQVKIHSPQKIILTERKGDDLI